MDLINCIKDKVRSNKLGLVLPEAEDIRVLKAAEIIIKEKLTNRLVLLGNPKDVNARAKKEDINLGGIEILDYINSPNYNRYTDIYFNLRKEKGMTQAEANETLKSPIYYGMFMVREGEIDTLVSGSLATTASVLKATIQVIGLDKSTRTVSSCFLMIIPNCFYGEEGAFMFADAGAVPDPTAEQLADIAISTANTAKVILGKEPRVAMLSFSTKGSAKHRLIEKVVEATNIAKQKAPDLLIDGELQADSAIITEVAQRKLKDSPVAGRANVLIFPDLNSGNISYKLVQRLANAKAFGPLIQGIKKPLSDLSRGCSVSDIVNTSAITLLMTGLHR